MPSSSSTSTSTPTSSTPANPPTSLKLYGPGYTHATNASRRREDAAQAARASRLHRTPNDSRNPSVKGPGRANGITTARKPKKETGKPRESGRLGGEKKQKSTKKNAKTITWGKRKSVVILYGCDDDTRAVLEVMDVEDGETSSRCVSGAIADGSSVGHCDGCLARMRRRDEDEALNELSRAWTLSSSSSDAGSVNGLAEMKSGLEPGKKQECDNDDDDDDNGVVIEDGYASGRGKETENATTTTIDTAESKLDTVVEVDEYKKGEDEENKKEHREDVHVATSPAMIVHDSGFSGPDTPSWTTSIENIAVVVDEPSSSDTSSSSTSSWSSSSLSPSTSRSPSASPTPPPLTDPQASEKKPPGHVRFSKSFDEVLEKFESGGLDLRLEDHTQSSSSSLTTDLNNANTKSGGGGGGGGGSGTGAKWGRMKSLKEYWTRYIVGSAGGDAPAVFKG